MKDLDINKLVNKLNKEGYLILKNIFPKSLIDNAANFVSSYDFDKKTRLTSSKKNNDLLALSYNPKVLSISKKFFNQCSAPIQSLTFKYPSNQPVHQDTVHFSTYPRDLMLACWIALENISDDQGPLCYIPKSHLLPSFSKYEFPNKYSHLNKSKSKNFYNEYEKDIAHTINELNFKLIKFNANAGDCFIWHPRLWHGGSPSKKNKTRLSYVTHYMATETPIYLKHFGGLNFFPRFQNPKELKNCKSLYKYGFISMLSRLLKLL